ncbi:unnamed protein product [Rotaria socialis]|uniref:Calpain catalytic domain-containing protein n=1 Tax=Rotaria socialis TaxID=392032 RepID=A0A818Z6F4_9BILA|nr:unnamed protein product [Rotaria socialis]CAF4542216.1 unnamed protein product [Rotaria socialis]
MATALSNTSTDSSLLSIFEQWWCPICSSDMEDGPLCQMCQKVIKESEEDLSNNDQSKSAALYSQYKLYRRAKSKEYETGDQDKSISDDKNAVLINSEAAPPTRMSLTIRDRRHMHESGAQVIFNKIKKYCRQENIHFVDDQFPPIDASIGSGTFNQVAQWLRISNVAPSSEEDRKLPWTIFSSPGPSDIAQGALGNCWLVAALALVSEKPRLLEHILLTKTINNEGVYMVRVCHNGLWKTIIIDDCFPCTRHKNLVFTQAKRRQLYVPLIEKSCAKLFGSYAALRSGNMREGLQLLTGAPCDYIDLQPTNNTLDGDMAWAQLLSACESKLLIGVSSGGTAVSSEEYAHVHIHKDHAFSLLAANALRDASWRFVLVRDPHSHSTYREELVTESILKQLRAVNPEKRSTGAFWISWPRFLRYFSSITISHYNSDHYDIREVGKFTRSSTQQVTIYNLHVPESSTINISLVYHRRDRKTRTSHTQSFVLCDTSEFAATGIVGARESIIMSERGGLTYWVGALRAGDYALVPFSTSFWQNDKEKRDFTIVIHSSVQISLTTETRPATFLADCLISAVIRIANKKQDKEAVFYTTSNKLRFRVFIVENLSITNYLNLDVNIQIAKSVRHSRFIGAPHATRDCIPPRHRQIVFAIEWIDKTGVATSLSYSYLHSHTKQPTDPRPPISISGKDFHSWRAF